MLIHSSLFVFFLYLQKEKQKTRTHRFVKPLKFKVIGRNRSQNQKASVLAINIFLCFDF